MPAMIPFRLLDTATEHGATLRLYQRGMEFSIRVDKAADLMNSRVHHSEAVLAKLACTPIAKRKNATYWSVASAWVSRSLPPFRM
ncbi:MAG: hypothetical protein Q9M16_00345 [Mariprofundus sp.]|nr:hypothetical protein [Mariprofundus sp.]